MSRSRSAPPRTTPDGELTAASTDVRRDDAVPYRLAAGQQFAREKGWTFEIRPGDWTLLRKLFEARWDDDVFARVVAAFGGEPDDAPAPLP